MIQILGLRRFTPKGETEEKTYDAFHDKNWRAESVPDLFQNLEKHLEQIPTKDRWNIFYTIANCEAGKREFKSLGTLAFDIDGIDKERINEYLDPICEVLGVTKETIGIVASGNGLHFLIHLASPITQAEYFKENRYHYKEVCRKINEKLQSLGLQGSGDSSVFEPRRILRLPGTVNRKPDKPETLARLLNSSFSIYNLDLAKLSGLPTINKKDGLSVTTQRRYPKVDTAAVLDGCNFLKWAKENANDVTEPQWYAALSITARLDDGDKHSHELSAGHHVYSEGETNQKIEQALEASGPRTCDNINALWDGCARCPNYKKVASPILIAGEGHIATENTGFHTVTVNGKGEEKAKPCHEDLRKFFKKETNYVVLGGTRSCYIWDKNHYKELEHAKIENYAYLHFNPEVDKKVRQEFRDLVTITEIKPVEWFEESTEKKMNFLNGYYDFERKDFLPHTPEIGFRHVLGFDYDPKAKCPLYDAMLKKLSCNQPSIELVLDEVGGYVVSGDRYWLHKAIVLEGEGANGKSTWLNILKAIVGKDNYTSFSMRDLSQEYSRQAIDRKLLNVSEETPTSAILESSTFKMLTSGQDIMGRAPYKAHYQIRNIAKMVFSCNELPETRDTTHGFFRRLLIVPFHHTFRKDDPDFDPFIEEKLLKELPGIFNRFMAGYARLIARRDFSPCDAIAKVLEAYREGADTVATWVKENVRFHPVGGEVGRFIPINQIYQEYCVDMKNFNLEAVHLQRFTKALIKCVPDYEARYANKEFEKNKRARGLLWIDIAQGAGLTEFLPKNVLPLADFKTSPRLNN